MAGPTTGFSVESRTYVTCHECGFTICEPDHQMAVDLADLHMVIEHGREPDEHMSPATRMAARAYLKVRDR